MKTKLITTLTALLMLVGISAQAQTGNQTPASAESTDLEGDLNHDGKVDVADVTYLVNLIMKNQSEAKDGTYYWYIGVENPASISDIQTDNTKPGWHEIGSSLSGFELNTSENQIVLYTSNTRTSYYVVIPNELDIYDEDNASALYSFTSIECNITGYKAYKYNNQTRIVRGIIIKEGTSNEVNNDNFYWYIGVDNPASISDIQTDNTKPGWHEIGASLDGFRLDTTGDKSNRITLSDDENGVIGYYVIIPKELNIYDSNEDSGYYLFNEVTCTINGYKAFKYKSQNEIWSVKGIIIKESNESINDNFYWYIGADNPSVISDIQSDNTVAGWHEIGTSLDGFVLDTNPRENRITVSTTDDPVRYYVIIPNGLNIYDASEDNGYYLFNEVTCTINGYKAYQIKDKIGAWTAKGIIIKEGTSNEPINGNFYWYIGAENPASISDIQTDNTVAGWHEIGESLNGFELITTNNPVELSTTGRVRYYVVIPNELSIFDDDYADGSYMFDEITCNIPGYKAYIYYNEKGVWDVVGIIIKESTSKEPINDNFYWYIGVDNPASISDIQADNKKPGWHEIGTSLDGFTYDMNPEANWVTLVENATNAADAVQYYVVIPNNLTFTDAFNSNLRLNGEYTPIECNISGYEAYKSVDDTVKVRGIIFKGTID